MSPENEADELNTQTQQFTELVESIIQEIQEDLQEVMFKEPDKICRILTLDNASDENLNALQQIMNHGHSDLVKIDEAIKRQLILMLFAHDLIKLKLQSKVDPSELYVAAYEIGNQLLVTLTEQFQHYDVKKNELSAEERSQLREICTSAINQSQRTIINAASHITGLEKIEHRFKVMIILIDEMSHINTKGLHETGLFGAKNSSQKGPGSGKTSNKDNQNDFHP